MSPWQPTSLSHIFNPYLPLLRLVPVSEASGCWEEYSGLLSSVSLPSPALRPFPEMLAVILFTSNAARTGSVPNTNGCSRTHCLFLLLSSLFCQCTVSGYNSMNAYAEANIEQPRTLTLGKKSGTMRSRSSLLPRLSILVKGLRRSLDTMALPLGLPLSCLGASRPSCDSSTRLL